MAQPGVRVLRLSIAFLLPLVLLAAQQAQSYGPRRRAVRCTATGLRLTP
jgi:hypothetical protein